MDAKEYLHRQFQHIRWFSNGALKDMTEEQFNWTPPGLANPIRVTLLHMLGAQDAQINSLLKGQPRLWESQGWGEKLGIPMPPGRAGGWEEARDKAISLATILEYRQVVDASTDAYLESLTPEELDRTVMLFGNEAKVADVLTLMIAHILGHSGEIAAIRGMQGVKGLPF